MSLRPPPTTGMASVVAMKRRVLDADAGALATGCTVVTERTEPC